MKLIAHLQLILVLALLPVLSVFIVASGSTSNLFDNPSLEIIENGLPRSWAFNSWGDNEAASIHSGSANSGERGVRTEVSNYTSGDAKWFPAPVAVNSQQNYTFSEYYKSNTDTQIIIQYMTLDNVYSYEVLQTASAQANWSYIEHTVDVPDNGAYLTVFHVLASVGWLEVDDYSLSVDVAEPTGENLVSNPSLEQSNNQNPETPIKWVSNSYGVNSATFEYLPEGLVGDRSVRSTVTSYTSGDAKWYFEPVSVDPGEQYLYSHSYKSDVTTQAVLQFTAQDGTTTYSYIGEVSPSANWQEFTTEIVVPGSAVKVSVFHVLPSIGQLTLDNASLTAKSPTTNPIVNPSLETGSSQPSLWNTNRWGSNDASFEYLDEGRTGDKSYRTTITDYMSGDGKLFFNPISLDQGQEFQFSVWYKTNTLPDVVAFFILEDGTAAYQGLPTPQPGSDSATQWQEYSETFTMRSDATSVSVFMRINSVGWVQTDDYSIADYQAQGFDRPLVTLTFDDGHEINTSTALPIMQSHGFVSTQCYATTYIEDAENEQQAIADVLQFRDAGHEICSHTVTHPFLTQLSQEEASYELAHSQEYLQSITGDPIKNFASPFGDYDTSVVGMLDDYYQSHRTVDSGYNGRDSFDIYRIKVQNVLSTTTIEEYQGWLDYAAATNTWLVLVYHRVAEDPSTYETYTVDFVQQMQALAGSSLEVKTYQSALEELVPQL